MTRQDKSVRGFSDIIKRCVQKKSTYNNCERLLLHKVYQKYTMGWVQLNKLKTNYELLLNSINLINQLQFNDLIYL